MGIAALATLLVARAAHAEPHLRAVKVATPPVIDGVLDDPAWKLAPPSGSFTQKIPNDGAAPSDPTIVRVVYDDEAVYVAFDCPQHTPVARRLTRRDRWVEADSVQFDLGTRGDHKSAFEFYVNASGTLIDAIRFNDTDFSSDWDENWEAQTFVTDTGWSAEFRIPLRILRFPTAPVQSWDFQASRFISARQEQDDWAYFPRSVAGEVSHYGRLDDLRGLHEQAPLELRPFVLGRVRRRDSGAGIVASGTDALASAGLDVKWHPTQSLTLDAAFNPDFAQVEADQYVLNLSTVETYYPEKRPFFKEGIDRFATPFELLYTRRIGRVPPLPGLRTDRINNEKLVDVPEPTAILGATKLTGQLAEGWSVGTVQAVTARNRVQVQLGDGSRVPRVLDPLSSFNVVRLQRDLGSNAHVALMATAVTRAESTDQYPLLAPGVGGPGVTQLCPDPIQLTPLGQRLSLEPLPRARCFNDAYVGAADWRWRSQGGEYSTGGQVVATALANGPDRPVADGTVLRPGDVGLGAKAYAHKDGGKHWVGGVDLDLESRRFEVNDLGYNARANQLAGSGYIEYRDLEPNGAFLEKHYVLSFGTQYNEAGLLIGQGTHFDVGGRFRNFWSYDVDVYYRGNKYDDREIGDGTTLRRDGALGSIVDLTTDTRKRVAVYFHNLAEAIYDGYAVNGRASVNTRILPQWDLDVIPTWQFAGGEPRFAATGPNAGQYLFGRLFAQSVGVTLRTTYTFHPRLTLQTYLQLFLAAGHYSGISQYQSDPTGPRPVVQLGNLTSYGGPLSSNPDFEQGALNVNVVLRWEYTLGSIFYLVYTRAQIPTTVLDPSEVGVLNVGAVGRAPASDAVLAKLSFWWGT
jgi:hypothetical protein